MRAQCLADFLKNSEAVSRYNKVYILPIPSSRDGVMIGGVDLTLGAFVDALCEGDLVLGYGLSRDIAERISSRGAVLCESLLDEAFLLENARLTAEATLGILASLGKRSLSDMRLGIVGYGRIGRALLSMLLYLGAHTLVYTGRDEVIFELSSLGVRALGYEEFDASEVDAIINTAPSDVFWRGSGEALLRSGAQIIELASGDNFGDGTSRGLKISKYPSLPSRMFPVSAGEAWARSVERFLFDRQKRCPL